MLTIFVGDIQKHPMFPAFVELAAVMGNASNNPEDDIAATALENMDRLGRMIYSKYFANQRSREEFAIFITILMTIYHKQFLDES